MWLHKSNSCQLSPSVLFAFSLPAGPAWWSASSGARCCVYHATFCINSLAHVRGRKRYVTGDDSRNNWLLAIFTMGEGWHNNHHAYQSSVRQGFKWWEIDPTYYILRSISWLGIVWNLKTPPEQVLRNERRLAARVVNRAAEQLVAHFNSERIALAITSAVHGTELAALRERLATAHNRATEMLAALQVSQMPTREDLSAAAKAMFARTPSLDEIADRAYELLLASVGRYLAAPFEHHHR